MTQKEILLSLFSAGQGKTTLGIILSTTLAAEYRRLMTDMRKVGYDIVCVQHKPKSLNEYYLIDAPKNQYKGVFGALPQKEPKDTLSPEIRAKVDSYQDIRNGYPINSPHRVKIDEQIDKLIEKESK